MKARFDAGTSVALLGAWDPQRNALPFTPQEFKRVSDALDADARAGHIFLIHTHAGGGGAVDAYVGEPAPEDVEEA